MGGDEFVLLLSDLPKEHVARVAQKILDAFAEPFPVDGHRIWVTTSIGIALAPEDGDDAATLLRTPTTPSTGPRSSGGTTSSSAPRRSTPP